MARPSRGEDNLVSIGASTHPQRRQMVLSDMPKDDEPAVSPPPSTSMPPSAISVGAEMRERRRAWEASTAVPKGA